MGYVGFQDFGGVVAGQQPWRAAPVADAVPPGTGRLTGLEWQVVAIARKDGPFSLRRPGRLTTVLRALLGRPNPMLSDPRLEALRRIAVLTWRRGYSVSPREVRAFLDAGFTARQYEALADHIGAARAVASRRARFGRSDGHARSGL